MFIWLMIFQREGGPQKVIDEAQADADDNERPMSHYTVLERERERERENKREGKRGGERERERETGRKIHC